MPTSPYAHLYDFMEYLNSWRPRSVLDIGLGNGKLGFIARDYLDVMIGERYHRRDWQIRLEGIEVYADYIQDHQRAIYDKIHIGDAFDAIDALDTFDVVVLGDVLEHFDKEKGWLFLDKCMTHSRMGVTLFVPLGENWKQPAIYGNPHEEHRSAWMLEEFAPMSSKHHLYNYSAGPYGAFLISKEDYITRRIEALKWMPFTAAGRKNGRLRDRLNLSKGTVAAVDLSALARHAANTEYCGYFLDREFREHYRLLACLSQRYIHSILFDVGTLKGYSALALSYNAANRVVSYDLADYKQLNAPESLTRIEYRIGNVLTDHRLLSSPLILLDTYHDGEFEHLFYAHLKKHGYRGVLILDDIHLNDPMRSFWNSIDLPKEDVTDIGHWSGTGLVDFSR
jgi:SAM-dependent methyltransferase